jgi:hypothetical protein
MSLLSSLVSSAEACFKSYSAYISMLKLGKIYFSLSIFRISLVVFAGNFPPSIHFLGFSSSSSTGIVMLFSRMGKNIFSEIRSNKILFVQCAIACKNGSKIEVKFANEMPSLSTLFNSYRKTSLICNGIPLLTIVSSINKF